MAQLTRQDIAEVVEEVVDRVLDRKFDEKFDEKLGLRPGQTFDEKLDEKLDKKLDEKLDEKLSAFVEHLDDKFNSLAETISLMNANMGTLAKASDLQMVKDDVSTIKLAVKETNKDLHRLEGRFDNFEGRFDNLEARFDRLERASI